jgi:YVTN family beta-propeller protein
MIRRKEFMKRLTLIFAALTILFVYSLAMAEPFAYITNALSDNITVIDIATGEAIATIENVADEPSGVAVNPAGTKVYVAGRLSNELVAIDVATNTVSTRIPMVAPAWGVAFNSDASIAFVTTGELVYPCVTGFVSVIDAAADAEMTRIPVGCQPTGVALNPSDTHVYVANRSSNTLSAIDTSSNTVIATIPVGTQPNGVVTNPAGTQLYVAHEGSNDVWVIDTLSMTVTATIPVGSAPIGIAMNPSGTELFVANNGVPYSLSVIDATTNTVTNTIPLQADPIGVAFTIDGTKLYATGRTLNRVYVIDTSSYTVTGSIATGEHPHAFGQFISPPLVLAASVKGSGTGTIVSPGLSCTGSTCIGSYPYNTTVHITPTASADSIFTGWTGCDSTDGEVCLVNMISYKEVSATFDLNQRNLTVIKSGTGTGSVVSDPAGMDCDIVCAAKTVPFIEGTEIALTAQGSSGSAFAYWSGACSGTLPTCNIILSVDMSVTAHFVPDTTKKYKLKVAQGKLRKGTGNIRSEDGTINCTTNPEANVCEALYFAGTPITLIAETSDPNTFVDWKPTKLNCTGTGPCTVTMDKNKKVKARFEGPSKLKVGVVSKNGGEGTVTGPALNCPDECEAYFKKGEIVTIAANPLLGSTFTGWSGGACKDSVVPTCAVTMDKGLTVKALFTGQSTFAGTQDSAE